MNSEQIKNSIREKYDREVALYDGIFDSKAGKHFIKRKLQMLASYGYIKEGLNLLEIGSATGVFSFEFKKCGINLTSIDLSPENIKWVKDKARERNSSINFQLADAENLPFENNSFDGVLSLSTLRYVPNINKALQEIYRVTKPGGFIILDFPNKKCPWFGGLKKKILGREHIYDNHYDEEQIKKMISQAKFTNIEIKTGLFIPKSTSDRLFGLFKIVEFIAEHLPLLKDYSAIIFVGAKK